VQIGRPYLYGLSVASAEGVAQIVQLLKKELELAMMLCGRPNIGAINRTVLW
jgi:4-hydroxymandelate oxidase